MSEFVSEKSFFRVGKVQKEIAPGKASVLSPKKYPISFELWSGNKSLGWQTKSVAKSGTYTLRFRGGQWSFSEHIPRKTSTVCLPVSGPGECLAVTLVPILT